jgi:hypothetical protein
MATECMHLHFGGPHIDVSIANAICYSGVSEKVPQFSESLDAVKLIINMVSDYTHYGVLRKESGSHSGFVTPKPIGGKPSNMCCSTDASSDVLALCAAALFALADKVEHEQQELVT